MPDLYPSATDTLGRHGVDSLDVMGLRIIKDPSALTYLYDPEDAMLKLGAKINGSIRVSQFAVM